MRRMLWAGLILLLGAAQAAPPVVPPPRWVASWSTSQQIPEPHNILAPELMKDSTLRQFVRLSIGGSAFRLRLSNAFGSEPLHLRAVHVARPAGAGAIVPASDRPLTFSGRADVIIPPGASYLSDAVPMPLAPFSDLAITIAYGDPPAVQTGHPGSRTTSYVASGDHVADAVLPDAKLVDHWYQIASVEVLAPARSGAIVVIGDSITDGRGSTTNGNDRWTNFLAVHLQAHPATRHLAVLNAGLGGNRLLNDGLGPNVLARFDRDVLAQPGVAAVILLEGVNDLGTLTRDQPVPFADHDLLVRRMIAGYQQVAARAHAHGLKAYIGTILPFMETSVYHPDAMNEADRDAVNAWIRVQNDFDGVIDFDKLMRDPSRPDHLNPAFDTGDFLHPSPAGYAAMGQAAASVFLPPARPALRAHVRKKKR